MGSLNISCALWSLTSGKSDSDLEKGLETAAQDVGVKAVQPWCVDVAKWKITCVLDPQRCVGGARKDWVKRIRAHGLQISGFCAQLTGAEKFGSFESGPDLQDRVARTQGSLRLAADMEAPVVTTHIGVIPEDRGSDDYKRFLECTREVAKAGEECGACFALETGQESAAVLKQFIEDVGSEAVKVNYDPANMLKWGTVEGVTVLKDYIVHTHAKDRHPQTGKPTVGQGAVPWDEYIAALKGIGYAGWYALEDESGSDVLASLIAGHTFLDKY